MDSRVFKVINGFSAIGLDELNAKAAMLERRDNKYIVDADRLLPALASFGHAFDVLEIGGKRAFTYDTRYFDCADLRGYYDHHQGRRKRCKVRIRDYVDAGFSYLEAPQLVTGDRTVLEPGMVLAVDGSVAVDTFRAQVGDSFIVTEDGFEQITDQLPQSQRVLARDLQVTQALGLAEAVVLQ